MCVCEFRAAVRLMSKQENLVRLRTAKWNIWSKILFGRADDSKPQDYVTFLSIHRNLS
jgi:hypothetical protein